jgi:3-deoxy-7-phosphoheptulonate synthase
VSGGEVFAVVLDHTAPERWDAVLAVAEEVNGIRRPVVRGDAWAAISVGDGVREIPVERLRALDSVQRVVAVGTPYCLANRDVVGSWGFVTLGPGAQDGRAEDTIVGDGAPVVIAAAMQGGPAADRFPHLAAQLSEAGVAILHAGEFSGDESRDPSTVGRAGLERLREQAAEAGMALSVEVSDSNHIARVQDVVDVVQAGSRTMQDFSLLRALGASERPVLLKRGTGATVEEFLLAAEYVLMGGNGRVMLCESGIRTFDAADRPRFEINAIPLLKRATHLPVLADPSHTATSSAALPAVVRGAVAAGADGVVLSVGSRMPRYGPSATIDVAHLRHLRAGIDAVARAVGRRGHPHRPSSVA